MLRNYGKHHDSKNSKVYVLHKKYDDTLYSLGLSPYSFILHQPIGMVLLKDKAIITSIHDANMKCRKYEMFWMGIDKGCNFEYINVHNMLSSYCKMVFTL